MSAPGTRTIEGAESYRSVRQDHEYTTDIGLLPLPLASPTPRVRLFRLHGGLSMRRVKWSASRAGKPPIIPAAADAGSDVLISTEATPALPVPNSQAGGYDWGVSGEYLYVQTKPRTPGTNALPTGGYPYPVPGIDGLLNAIVTPAIGAALVNQGLDAAISLLSAPVNHTTDSFLWPLTTLAPVFSAPDLIQ